jgi:hypothetical protein
MSSLYRRPASRNRMALVSLIAIIATLAVAFPSGPALASGTSGGGGSGGIVDGGHTDNGTIECKNGYGVRGGQKEFDRLFPRCRLDGTPRKTTTTNLWKYQYCLVGFDVFRFYGKKGQNPTAWTRSLVNLDQDTMCAGQAEVMLFSPNPMDAFETFDKPEGDAWTKKTGTNRQGQKWNQAANGYLTTGSVIANSATTCDDLNNKPSTDPIAKYWARNPDGTLNTKYADQRGVLFEKARSQVPAIGEAAATAILNAKWEGSFPASVDAVKYDDGLKCSSDVDFATANGTTPTVYGSCYVPLLRRVNLYRQENGDVDYAYFMNNSGGTRYSDDTKADGNFPEWRDQITKIVKGAKSSKFGASYKGSPRYTPASQGTPAMEDRNAAAKSAHDNAVCVQGTASTSDNDVKLTPVQEISRVDLEVDTPSAFQVGGSSRPQTVNVSVGDVYCKTETGEELCSSITNEIVPTLRQLHFGVDVVGTGGYRICNGTTGPDCDATVIKKPTRLSESTAAVDRSIDLGNFEINFYRATQPGQTVSIRMTPGHAPSASHSTPWGTYWRPMKYTRTEEDCTNSTLPGEDASTGEDVCTVTTITYDGPPEERNIPRVTFSGVRNVPVISGTEGLLN